ncbi:hypothetical protein BV20DRAFT_959256 [Pilatotrama ljubarskyi]|nr:hypothetical protein BV20DRAFT_959256 [Pilatotrama ljubarskyi]
MYRKYRDTRTWRRRVRTMDENWQPLMPQLVDAYLEWKEGLVKPAAGSEYDFEVDILDIYTTDRATTVPRSADVVSPAEALVRHGYLGTVPLNPSLAISLRTLELLRILRLFKPSLSIEAFTKVVCYIYMTPYRRHHRTAISDAFDIYLAILRSVRQRVQAALGRDTPHWRALNSCPPCSYVLEGEIPPTFDRLLVMDGNNSLKRVGTIGGRSAGDLRTFESDYFLPTAYVDKFANEIKAAQAQEHVDIPMADGDEDSADENGDTWSDTAAEGSSDPTDGGNLSSCTKNWKAAASDEKKRMWSIFDECGVFACACRHGLLLWLADMVRSGEKAKFPIAIAAMIATVLRIKVALGYDIGCSFDGTLHRSSIGPEFFAAGSRMVVNAFHGYSHAYPCQVRFHPNVIQGIGLEDLETLERIFSASNQLASVTRHATPFRRRMLIDLFFQQWDDEKYQNLGQMLYNNYVQALDIIRDMSPVVAEAMRSLSITTDDLRAFGEEEREYFATLTDEDSWDVHAVAYVEVLQQLHAFNATARFFAAVQQDYHWTPPESGPTVYAADLSVTRKLETARRLLNEKIDNLSADAVRWEDRLGISRRWQPGDREYDETLKYIASRRYHQALGKLQRLVVQRLFELHKLNLSQTAYRVRSFIAKNLQKRCKAIRRAVDEYNRAAAELSPPRPALDWSKVSHFSFIEEFTLLQDTRNDLRGKRWAEPVVREAMRKARRIERAREELANVNREARRLHTAIRDEDVLFTTVLDNLRAQNDPIYTSVLDYCTRRRAANAHNLVYLQRLYSLDGFSGDPTPGIHRGASEKRPRPTTTASKAGPLSSGPSHVHPSEMSAGPVAPSVGPHTAMPVSSSLQGLTASEMSEVQKDEEDAEVEADEDDIMDIAGLVDHMANVAFSM